MQFFNMFVFLTLLCGLLYQLQCMKFPVRYPVYWKILACFILLSSPYLAKNIIMCLGEWFVIMLFVVYIMGWYKRWFFISVFALALIPFIRQNLLLLSIMLMIFILLRTKNHYIKLSQVVLYLSIVMLPVYHNLYYAGVWRFFVNIDQPPVTFSRGVGVVFQQLINTVTPRALRYLGYEKGAGLSTLIFGILFAPFTIVATGYLVYKMPRVQAILMGVAIVFVAGPVLLLGYAYYPRFEFVNLYLILLVYPIIYEFEIPNLKPVQ